MEIEQYYVIQNSDGDTIVTAYSKDDLEKALFVKAFGDKVEFLDAMFDSLGMNETSMWGDSVMIIKGRTVQPTPVKVIKTYHLP
jgi:hypothetical protein